MTVRVKICGVTRLEDALAAARLGAATGSAGSVPEPAGAAELRRAVRPEGRPRVVHVWATWCAPCVAEWPALAATLRAFAGRVDVVTVALDEPERRAAAARILAVAGGVPGHALLVTPREGFPALTSLDPEWDGAIPGTYLLAADGTLVLAHRGVTRLRALAEGIERLTEHGAPRARDVVDERRR